MKRKDSLSIKLFKLIKKLQKQLDNNVKKFGLHDIRTREIMLEIDKLINEYYDSINLINFPVENSTTEFYDMSYAKLKTMTKENLKFPSTEEWNKIAMEEGYFCSISMQYISELDWNYLRVKVEREINIEKFLKYKKFFSLRDVSDYKE